VRRRGLIVAGAPPSAGETALARAPARAGARVLGLALVLALGVAAGSRPGAMALAAPAVPPAAAAAAAAGTEPGPIALAAAAQVDTALEAWDIARAAVLVEKMRSTFAGDPTFAYAEGRLLFFQGDYDGAAERLAVAARAPGAPSYFGDAYDRARLTRAATKDLDVVPSRDGRVVFRVSKADRVLVPYAEEAFARIVDAVSARLGFTPTAPVRVEFVPEVERLSAMTGLAVEAIHTSGTIAICKFDKLMVTSPRALLYGYGWLDTVAHEYVHYAVNHLTGATVPIWLHEGLAKYLEQAWRLPPGPDGAAAPSKLPPAMEHLLAVALRTGKLIPFEKMHPSMALLPSQEEAALAFAEVFTMVDFLVARAGWDGVRGMLGDVGAGTDVEDAVAAAAHLPFKKVLADWKAGLRGKGLRVYPGLVARGLAFRAEDDAAGGAGAAAAKDGADKGEEKPLLGEIKSDKARKHLRLGELLRGEGKMVAAVIELEKAHSADAGSGPTIALKLGRAYLDVGRPERAVAVVEPLVALYPEMVGVHVVLGRGKHALGDEAAAVEHLTEALRINPFDPGVHRALAEAYEKLGRAAEAERERTVLTLLRS
jgi:hypothetical protein